MKKIVLIIAICASFASTAQNLESKIPSSAEAVVSINGDRLLELVSTAEFDNYGFAKKMFEELVIRAKSDDMQTLTKFTGEILQQCVACHSIFKMD